ncbi:MAG: hypothetical protein DRG78_24890, partial [Epsilonproteobacteria bacterium]
MKTAKNDTIDLNNPQNYIRFTFNENIQYLEKEQKELFSKLVALDSAIEQGHYQEKYELVYENNNFDVVDKKTKNYLYNKQSTHHANLA